MGEKKIHGGHKNYRRNSAYSGATPQPTFAAVDLGTNNCRLLIARPVDAAFRVIDAFSRIVRLGEGLGANGYLSEAAMVRTISALRVCAGKMRRHRVTRARCIATDACRRAANCDAFVQRVARETGIELDIITAKEEAHLVLAGSRPLLDPDVPWALLFDIGGGSTELLWMRLDGELPEIVGWTSLPHGVVSLAETHGGDTVPRHIFEAMVADIQGLLAAFEDAHGIRRRIARGDVQMLGASGTVTTLAGVHLELPRYDRARVDGLSLTFDDLDRVSDQLRGLDQAARALIPTIGPDRADLVVAGCAILDAIQRRWPVGALMVADRGIREGLLMGMMHPCMPAAAGHVAHPGSRLPEALRHRA